MVEDYCQIRNIKCDALLNPQLIGLEGYCLRLKRIDGRIMDRWIDIAGKYILYHIHKGHQKSSQGGACHYPYQSVHIVR